MQENQWIQGMEVVELMLQLGRRESEWIHQ
jgi:hypothetical protein